MELITFLEELDIEDIENGGIEADIMSEILIENRHYIESLVSEIPTEKNALFAYEIDWLVFDNYVMDAKVRPWVDNRIFEYLGEPYPALVDFICGKLIPSALPHVILEDLEMVLEEEAENFMIKLWKLIIFETEVRKLYYGY